MHTMKGLESKSPFVPAGGHIRRKSRFIGRALGGQRTIEIPADPLLMELERQARIGAERVRTVTRVGNRAMEAQALTSLTERMIVEMEPAAIYGVSHLSQRLTIGLGQVIDRTINEVC